MRFGYGVAISPTRTVTPEGFLSLSGCRIARIGGRHYLPEEEDRVQPKDGRVTIMRTKESLFAPQTIESFEGKPVSLEHPPGVEMFDAETWKKYLVGVMLHVREGRGEDAGCLVADLLLYDKDAINAVMSGEMTELSIGYHSSVHDVGGGVGVESPLTGNHVALVPKGRCGSICAVKDAQPTGEKMFFPKKDEETAGTTPAGESDAIKALQEQVNALQEQIAHIQKDEEPTDEEKKDEEQADDEKKDEGEEMNTHKPEEQFVPTPEAIAQIVIRVLEAREKQAVVDEDVKKDAATVAPSLSLDTPNLAVEAIREYAKTEKGSRVLAGFGGVASVKKDSAPLILKAIAMNEREIAALSLGAGKKDAAPTKPSYFSMAKNLWK